MFNLDLTHLFSVRGDKSFQDMLRCVWIMYERISLGSMDELEMLSPRLSEN